MLSPLPTNQQVLDEINNIFYKFLWDGKGENIKKSIMISDYENGGLRMLDLNSFCKALKLSWVRKYLNDNNSGKWTLLFDFQLEDYGGVEFFGGNLDRQDVSKYINVPDSFITEIVQIWTEMSFEGTVKSIEHLLSLNLWHNSLVKVGKKPIYCKSWSTKGTQKVRHLMRDESKFLSFTEFKEHFDIKTNFLTFYGVLSSIKNLQNKVKTQPPPKGNFEGFIYLSKCYQNKQNGLSKIALALNRLALVKLKTNGLLTAKLPVLISITGKWYTNSPFIAQKYRN